MNTGPVPRVAFDMRALALVVVTGCWSNAQPAWTPPAEPAVATPGRCPITLAPDGHVFVWETDLGAFPTSGFTGTPKLAVYRYGDRALVALRGPDVRTGPQGSDTLWTVSCDGRKLASVTIPGADFGHAALHPEHDRLFFSTSTAPAQTLDLATRKATPLTSPPSDMCNGAPTRLRDIVTGATHAHVEFARGGPCGFEGEYTATLMRRHVELGVEEIAAPITAIVAVDREIWIAAGECGRASILRTSDWRSWKRLPVKANGRITLVADPSTNSVIMATALCSGTTGEPAMITRDRGATWTSASRDMVVEWVAGADFATMRGGAANGQHLRWHSTVLVGAQTTWKQPPALPANVTIDGRTVRPTRFGLYQGDERLFPR
jgi:hypothetical protein